jgi:hypothetical protein
MMAQILLEYSSDGPPPSVVDHTVQEFGFDRDGAFFVLEAPSEEEMRSTIDRLHLALQGSGTRYTVIAGEARPDTTAGSGGLSAEDLEGRVEEVSSLLHHGPSSFTRLLDALDIGEAELEEVLQEMADRGLAVAHRGDDGVSYRLAGPMLRSLAR